MVSIIFHDIDITVSRVTVEHLLSHTLVLLRAAGGFLSACVSQWAPPLPGITQHSWTLTTIFQHLLAEYISVSFSLASLFIPSLCFFCSRPPSAIAVWHVEPHQPALNIRHSASLFLSFISSFSLLHILSFLFFISLYLFPFLLFPWHFLPAFDHFNLFLFFYFLLFTLLYLFSSSFSFACFNFFRCFLLFTWLSILYFNLIYFLFSPLL